MKKIIALIVFALFLFLAANAVLWSVRFIREARLDSSGGRTNILILGTGGGAHEGADLTDTIMVLSIDAAKKTVALISIPRDVWSDTLKDKVNTAYHYGELKKKGGGLVLAKVIMEDVVGIPIHYALVIDFSGFTKVIDAVGGIDVNVPEAFTDTEYPCENTSCVYETIHFDAGREHMDGARALIYARSRHAEGDQGTDFARSRRQQIIMVALKDRFTHPARWITLSRLQALPRLLDDATDMDMTIAQAVTSGRRFAAVGQDQIKKIAFDQLLDNPPAYLYNNLYVLTPKTSWDDVHTYIKDQLK
jgi:LCP family protein required for cell wall assembly